MFTKLLHNLLGKSNKFTKDDYKQYMTRIEAEKVAATNKHEPWVTIISFDIDYEDISDGSFELDWNEYFITRLLKAGYEGKTESDIVDQWFNQICRNVVMETYEQEQADLHPIKSTKLSNQRRGYN